MEEQVFRQITKALRDKIKDSPFSEISYYVGGAVRDLLMGNPIKDIDIVVEMDQGGVKLAEYLRDMHYTKGSVVLYLTYGTAMLRLKEFPNEELEFVMTRGEKYTDEGSRNPDVHYVSLQEDAVRRDLTINALYYNISNGEILDPTGKGKYDIEHKILRVINDNPDIVFTEDALRILRVIRFQSRYGKEWHIEENTWEALKRNVHRLEIISKERIRDEFVKMIATDNPCLAMELLRDSGAMHYVIPELEETYEMTQNQYHCGTVWEHTLKVLDEYSHLERGFGKEANPLMRVACVLHDIGKLKCRTETTDGKVHFIGHEVIGAMMVGDIMRNLKFSNEEIEYVKFMVRNHMATKQWGKECEHAKDKHIRKLQYFCWTKDRFMELMDLIDADNRSHAEGHCMPLQVDAIIDRTIHMGIDGTDMFEYKLPVNGNDIMESYGVEEGIAVKVYKETMLKTALSNPKITKEELLRMCGNLDVKETKLYKDLNNKINGKTK